MTIELTIGMATYDDFVGVWPTIQDIRMDYPDLMDIIEFVVIDNNPSSSHGTTTSDFIRSWVPNGVYVPYTEKVGTAPAKNKIFDVARGKKILAMDSHILLYPGVLYELLDYYKKNPDTNDLLSGPMVYDNLIEQSNSFKDVWRGGMWGIWDTSWLCKCGKTAFKYTISDGGTITTHPPIFNYTSVMDGPLNKECDCKLPKLALGNVTQSLLEHGCHLPGSSDIYPFEIPAMGMGLFSCRKEAWLGFNPNFRQFGGEEFYIHTKYRQAGHKALCLPFLRWVHRFGRPSGVPYPLSNWNKVRNYVIGLTELKMDLSPIHEHFVGTGLVSEDEWKDILSGAVEPKPVATGGCSACQKSTIDNTKLTLSEWFLKARNTKSDINEHVDWIAQLSEGKEHVAVYGGHHDISTIAVLFAQPKKLTIVDLGNPPNYPHLQSEIKTQIQYMKGDDRHVKLGEVDLVFIDSVHTASHVYDQLLNLRTDAKRILLHDTVIFGERGDDGGHGIMVALRKFMKEYPEWSVIEHRDNNHGMTLISRLDEDKKSLPSTVKMAWNYAKAKTKHLLNGGESLALPLVEERLDVCSTCEFRVGNRCAGCGCPLDETPNGDPGKAFYPTEQCPKGKWKV